MFWNDWPNHGKTLQHYGRKTVDSIYIYIILQPLFYFIGACTVPDFPGCTLLGETPQQISANHVLAFACDNNATSNVTAFGATLMRCRENGTWEEVILDNRGLTKFFVSNI